MDRERMLQVCLYIREGDRDGDGYGVRSENKYLDWAKHPNLEERVEPRGNNDFELLNVCCGLRF